MKSPFPFRRTTLALYIEFILRWGHDSETVRSAGIDFANRMQEVQNGNQS